MSYFLNRLWLLFVLLLGVMCLVFCCGYSTCSVLAGGCWADVSPFCGDKTSGWSFHHVTQELAPSCFRHVMSISHLCTMRRFCCWQIQHRNASVAIFLSRYQMKMRSCLINSKLLLYKSWKNEVKSWHVSRVMHKVLLWGSVFTWANLCSLYVVDTEMSTWKWTSECDILESYFSCGCVRKRFGVLAASPLSSQCVLSS